MKIRQFVMFLSMILLCVQVAFAGISFIDPTPINNSRIYVNYTNINVSIPVVDLTNFTFNWNGTNTTYLNDSCVLHLSFDNNSEIGDSSTVVRDVSSYNNNGSFINGSTGTWTVDGKWNGGMDFDGINDYVIVPNDDSLRLGDGSKGTLSFWAKSNIPWEDQPWYTSLTQKGDGAGWSCASYHITKWGPTLIYRITATGINSGYNTLYIPFPSANEFHLFTMTWDGSNIYAYIDGIEEGTTEQTCNASHHSHEPLWIARSSGFRFFNGSIDEVRIYNCALSPDKIRQLYMSNLKKFNETQWYFESNQTNLTDNEYNYQGFANNDTTTYNTDYHILTAVLSPHIPHISCYSKYPETLYTNYTGFLSSSYIVESNYPLNMSTLSFLMGTNYTLTEDYHSYLKVPANDIADNGIYRAHNRHVIPYLSWEGNDTITEGNVWKWAGGDNNDFWITNESINATHTWVNMSGRASNVFPSMFYLGRQAMYESEKTGFEIHRGQGIIFKIWDLEQFRGRSHDYYLNLFFDTQMEADTTSDIEIWYCNDSFNPNTDDPTLLCDYKDTWSDDRWINHSTWQPHNNVSYCRPLQVHAGTTCPSSPTEVNYIYLRSGTRASRAFILNATNSDPNICNLTFAQTNTMWLRHEMSGTNTPIAYTPSFFNTFTRDYLEFTHHLYIANDQGTWGHSDYVTHEIGLSDIAPTHCRFNYFWWNGTTDYLMNGTYEKNFNVNLTYGFDPDNGASLTHVLSLYDSDYNFIAFINDSLIGNQSDVDIFIDILNHTTKYSAECFRLKIVSTDNEGSTSVTWSNEFCIKQDSWFKTTIPIITGFPAAIDGIHTSFLSFLPLFIGILISGALILVCVGVFGKLKRW